MLCGCVRQVEAGGDIENISRRQKIELAAAILGELRPTGYCASVPNLSAVLAAENSRVVIDADDPERSYPRDERGTVVGFLYVCAGADGRDHIAEHTVNLRTREVLVFQLDDLGAPHGSIVINP